MKERISAKSTTSQRAGDIARNVANGVYHSVGKFANFGSIAEDSVYYHTHLAMKAEARRSELEAQRNLRKVRA